MKKLREIALRNHKDLCMFPDVALHFRKVKHEMTELSILAALYSQPRAESNLKCTT